MNIFNSFSFSKMNDIAPLLENPKGFERVVSGGSTADGLAAKLPVSSTLRPETIPEETPTEVVPPTPNTPKKLKASERNKIIEDYKAGTIHPDFEIVTTKVPGKYIVKPRKLKLTEEQVKKVSPAPKATEKPTKVETIELPKPVVEKKKRGRTS
jgi:hypothetical protein